MRAAARLTPAAAAMSEYHPGAERPGAAPRLRKTGRGPRWPPAQPAQHGGPLREGPRQRDVFPLPQLPDLAVSRVGARRGVQRRVRRATVREEVNEAIWALNCLYFGNDTDVPVSPAVSSQAEFAALPECQRSCIDRVTAHVESFRDRGAVPAGHEALRQLLALGESYDASLGTTVVPYQPDLLSLPGPEARPVPLASVLAGKPRSLLVDFENRLLLTADEYQGVKEFGPKISLYKDQNLRASQKAYLSFLRRLHEAHLLDFTWRPRGRSTPLCVRKKRRAPTPGAGLPESQPEVPQGSFHGARPRLRPRGPHAPFRRDGIRLPS